MLFPILATCFFGTDQFLDNPAFFQVPPPGKTAVILERSYQDEELLSTRRCTIEHGDGSGIRTCSTTSGTSTPLSTQVAEGISTGLDFPDRTTYLGGSSLNGFLLRREPIEKGDRWRIDSVPGLRMPGIRFVPDSLIVRRDSSGREIERRSYPRGYTFGNVRRTQWGPSGAIVQTDSSSTETWLDSTFWVDGTISQRIRYHWNRLDTLPSRESFDWKDGRVVRSSRVHQFGSILDLPECETWHHLESRDTVRFTVCGELSDTVRIRGSAPPDTSRRGDTLVIQSSGETSGSRREFAALDGDPTPRLVRHTELLCEDGSCRDLWRTEFEYPTLDATLASPRQAKPAGVTVRRIGTTLIWSGTVSDEASLELRSPEGRLRATARFRNGLAWIEGTPARGILLWQIVPEAGRPIEGSILLR